MQDDSLQRQERELEEAMQLRYQVGRQAVNGYLETGSSGPKPREDDGPPKRLDCAA